MACPQVDGHAIGSAPAATPTWALAASRTVHPAETGLRAVSRHPTTQPSAAPATCAVVWGHGVPQGFVNHPHIDGMQEVSAMTGMHRLHQIDKLIGLLPILACRCDGWITRIRDERRQVRVGWSQSHPTRLEPDRRGEGHSPQPAARTPGARHRAVR